MSVHTYPHVANISHAVMWSTMDHSTWRAASGTSAVDHAHDEHCRCIARYCYDDLYSYDIAHASLHPPPVCIQTKLSDWWQWCSHETTRKWSGSYKGTFAFRFSHCRRIAMAFVFFGFLFMNRFIDFLCFTSNFIRCTRCGGCCWWHVSHRWMTRWHIKGGHWLRRWIPNGWCAW